MAETDALKETARPGGMEAGDLPGMREPHETVCTTPAAEGEEGSGYTFTHIEPLPLPLAIAPPCKAGKYVDT